MCVTRQLGKGRSELARVGGLLPLASSMSIWPLSFALRDGGVYART